MKIKSLVWLVFFVLVVVVFLCLAVYDVGASDPLFVPASILRGEAPTDCVKCREMTACAIVRDMQKGVNLRSRWYGWRNARPQDIAMIERAMNSDMCKAYPVCKFVGRPSDLEIWARNGWVSLDVQAVGYCSGKCSVCVPDIEDEYEVE